MDTSLTKSKNTNISFKILAFLNRALFFAAFFTTVLTGVIGRRSLLMVSESGLNAFSGDLIYLPEFKEYMEELIDYGLLGYVGSDEPSKEIGSLSYRRQFEQVINTGNWDIIYYIDAPAFGIHTNYSQISEDESGELSLPTTYQTYFYFNGPNMSSTDSIHLFSDTTGLEFNKERLLETKVILGIRKNTAVFSPFMRSMYYLVQGYRFILIYLAIDLFVTLSLGLLCLLSRKYAKEAMASYGAFTKKVSPEYKLLVLGLSAWVLYEGFYWWRNLETPFYDLPEFLWVLLPFGFLLYLLCADLRQNKTAVFKNSIPVKLVGFILEYQRSEHWYREIMRHCSIIVISAILTACTGAALLISNSTLMHHRYYRPDPWQNFTGCLLLFVSICLTIIYRPIRRFTKDTKAITDKLAGLQPGTPTEPLKLSEKSPLLETAENINRLEYNIENAVEQRNRSNKLRVELITNVSHDLKTPLTSIINYADLLCEEKLPEPASDYAISLREKSYRLRNMVQDVFELSKAASGNLRIEKQPLDLAKLIRQTLADMDERIEASSLTFKTVMESEPVMILADGEKLYRVFQNLFLNALQYSLENSRVHVLLSIKNNEAYVKIKNTSKEELNFDPSEILERFVRADTSRTTEGSGLGLSIVQSFTEACGGTFHVDLDADMFTACVDFPLTEVTLPEDGASL